MMAANTGFNGLLALLERLNGRLHPSTRLEDSVLLKIIETVEEDLEEGFREIKHLLGVVNIELANQRILAALDARNRLARAWGHVCPDLLPRLDESLAQARTAAEDSEWTEVESHTSVVRGTCCMAEKQIPPALRMLDKTKDALKGVRNHARYQELRRRFHEARVALAGGHWDRAGQGCSEILAETRGIIGEQKKATERPVAQQDAAARERARIAAAMERTRQTYSSVAARS